MELEQQIGKFQSTRQGGTRGGEQPDKWGLAADRAVPAPTAKTAAQRAEELRASGLHNDQIRSQLKQEGYDPSDPNSTPDNPEQD